MVSAGEARISRISESPFLVVRADADARIGIGHWSRSSALAEEWKRQGGQYTRLSRSPDERHPHPGDLGATLTELRTVSREGAPPPWLLLDGYHFTPEYHAAVRSAGYCLLVVDDMAHLPVYHADILLNQNAGAERLAYQTDVDTRALLGSRYALLRDEFTRYRAWDRQHSARARRILITMGGSDPVNGSLAALHAVGGLPFTDLSVALVIGALNPRAEELSAAAAALLGGRVDIIQASDEMASLMEEADLAIAAAGSTCWELAFMQLPMIITAIAGNQVPAANFLSAEGAAEYVGVFDQDAPARIAAACSRLLADREARCELSRHARRLVDGEGSARVVRVMTRISARLS